MSKWMIMRTAAAFAVGLAALTLTTSCGGLASASGPSVPTLAFDPPQQHQATVGQPFSYSFCRPALNTSAQLCGSLTGGTITPTGGKPTYHFQLGSGGGFPPTGLVLGLNGILSGTPTVGGPATFDVCAIDLAGNSACRPVTVEVAGVVVVQNVSWSCTISASPLPGWRNCAGTVTLSISRRITTSFVSVYFDFPTNGAFFHGELSVIHDGRSLAKVVTVNLVNEYVSRCVASYPTTVNVYDGRQSAPSAPLLVSTPLTLSSNCQ